MQNGDTAVIRAAGGGDLDIVRYLIEDCGADAKHATNVSNDVIIYDMGWYMYIQYTNTNCYTTIILLLIIVLCNVETIQSCYVGS